MKKNTKIKTIKTKQTTQKMKLDKTIGMVVIGFVVVSALLLIYSIYNLRVLPWKYVISATAVVLLIGGLLSYWVLKSKGNGSKVVSMLMVVALLFGVTQFSTIRNLIGKVTGADTETHLVHVAVLKASDYEKISDFKDLNADFGATLTSEKTHIDMTIEKIKDAKIEFNVVSYDDYISMNDALFEGEVEAIIIGESQYNFLKEMNPSYEEDVRIIETYGFEEKVEETGRDIDITKDTFSIFVSGIDTYGPLSSVSRSDVNMIMTVNPTTHQILLTSIPRDYHVTLHSFGAKDKLTHAGNFGVRESMSTLEDLLSSQVGEKVEIDYYLRVNFSSVVNIVDALGGVNVNSEFNFNVGNYVYTKGSNHVNGAQALAFVRERYSLPNGDNDRIKNQQALISGIIDKATSPAIITKYNAFLSSVAGSFELSIPDNDFNKLVKNQINSMEGWEIISIQLQGTGTHSKTTYSMPGWNLYVAEPKYETVKAAAEMILKMESGVRVSKAADWPFN